MELVRALEAGSEQRRNLVSSPDQRRSVHLFRILQCSWNALYLRSDRNSRCSRTLCLSIRRERRRQTSDKQCESFRAIHERISIAWLRVFVTLARRGILFTSNAVYPRAFQRHCALLGYQPCAVHPGQRSTEWQPLRRDENCQRLAHSHFPDV